MSGAVQRNLGQDSFNRLVRHAYDRGIRFFETSDTYGDMHRMLGIALKGIPRDTYQLMTKVTTEAPVDPQQRFDELRKQIKTDYFDIMLLHWQHSGDWPERHHALAGRHPQGPGAEDRHRPRRHPSTACPRSARCPTTSGSRSP